jgi:phage/plasmid primase-like uncharacterized protein
MSHYIDEFMSAMRSAGIDAEANIPADGKLHRFYVDGDCPGSKNGWAILFGDEIPIGLFGSWRYDSGKSYKWYSRQQCDLTPEQKAMQAKKITLARQLYNSEEETARAKCHQWCSDIWLKTKDATNEHPYLKAKEVPSYGLKQLGNSLLVPLRDVDGRLQGMQLIFPDGSKKFKTGTAKRGNYFAIGKPEGKILLLCEGYATGASIHECTGHAVAVCFDAGNLKYVVEVLKKKYSDHLFIVCGDNDVSGVGQKAAHEAAAAVGGVCAIPPATGQDFNDMHRKEGAAAVKARINATRLSGQKKGSATPVLEEWEPTINDWPTIDARAYRGLAGEFAALASEKSEADPVAVLTTFLVRFGVEVGSGPTLFVGDTKHRARLAAVVVGASSKARKGTSGKPIDRLFSEIEGRARFSPGPFSSGEGIIFAVRDEAKRWNEKDQTWAVVDPGITDKRLFVLDEEFAGVISQTKRDGNTLSMIIRNAWDNGNLDPLTKTSKTTATNVHVGWVSHVTIEELHAKLSDIETFNGFANRILWVCARRSKIVPLPEPMDESKLDNIRQRLVERIKLFRDVDFVKIEMSSETKMAWCNQYYADLTKDHPGLVGCVINRGEAQVVRLAMIYCLLDGMTTISLVHLEAAVALWRYCEQSARYVFNGRQTDGVAEKILVALAEKPMTSTEIHRLLANHVNKDRLSAVLSQLKGSNQIEAEQFRSEGQKKPTTLWKIKSTSEFANLCELNPTGIINFANSQDSQGVLEKTPSLACGVSRQLPTTKTVIEPIESSFLQQRKVENSFSNFAEKHALA